MIKLCKYLSTMWNRTDSRFVDGLNNIADRFLWKADLILWRHFTLLHSRFVKPSHWIWELFKKIILATGRDQETVKWEKKKNFIPKQNTHDLLVGTLSIGIPSVEFIEYKFHIAVGSNNRQIKVIPILCTAHHLLRIALRREAVAIFNHMIRMKIGSIRLFCSTSCYL